jgi:hypothetical protein
VPRVSRLVTAIATAVLAIALGGAIGLVVLRRVRTGHWQVPSMDDLVVLRHRLTGERPAPSRVIFLDRAARTITAGEDDAPSLVSSVVASNGAQARRVPGWKGSAKAWTSTVACVREIFAPFAVEVTDQPPPTREFLRVVVGGRPTDIGESERGIAGLAPFNGGVVPRAIVFSFAATQGHRPRAVCETIASEIAHAYGLDHEYLCSDVMSYLPPCGKRRFIDRDARCGEGQARTCASGGPTQNSHRKLLAVLGPASRS